MRISILVKHAWPQRVIGTQDICLSHHLAAFNSVQQHPKIKGMSTLMKSRVSKTFGSC